MAYVRNPSIPYQSGFSLYRRFLKLIFRGKIREAYHLLNPHYFIHIPKCAGNSIFKYCAENQLHITVLDHDIRKPNYIFPCNMTRKNRHRVFCIVRNPFDRLVSAYTYLQKGGNCKEDAEDFEQLLKHYGNFENFVLQGLGNPDSRKQLLQQIHLIPQSAWLTNRHGLCVSGKNVLKYENIDNDFASHIRRITGHSPSKLPTTNQSAKAKSDYRQLYTRADGSLHPGMIAIVIDVYRRDFEMFEYSQTLA